MDAQLIRSRLHTLQDLVAGPKQAIIFQALEKVASGTNKFSYQNVARICFFMAGGFIYKDLGSVSSIPASKTLTFAPYDKDRYREMWEEYLMRHDVHTQIDQVVFINSKNKKLFGLLSKKHERQTAREIHAKLFNSESVGYFEKVFTFWELVYCLKMERYHRAYLEERIVEVPSNFLTVGESVIPGVIYSSYLKEQGSVIDSFQFFNLSEDQEYKVHAESVWSNMIADRYFVWGEAYKNFMKTRVPNTEILIIGHPLYKETLSHVTIPEHRNIIIAANPPEMSHINRDFFRLVFSFARTHGYQVFIRLHPNDSIETYSEFTGHREYRGLWNREIQGIYVVNNSTVYFDLIYDQQVAIRYKHPKSCLTIAEEIQDYFKNEDELLVLISALETDTLNTKRDEITKHVLGLENL